ncbi:glucarate dehydratase family protein [Dactylosporangium sp. AC04546]|uniref:glucarate dehydratase family protein n=1 Tax=Dactylosporangium sp. AC04546 TaxID=2862460 RepID=UPI001EDE9ED7|nr:glucarate dehydratase family protein [Dactylosporangium sp. AC04546]WVK79557.1 glucarate dehydratase family protein [Dactylosporangium sp. AC04546]
MRIAGATVTPVAFPDPPLLNSAGVHEPWALRTIVELTGDDGVTGIAETYGDAPHLQLVRTAARTLAGIDPFDLAAVRRSVAAVVAGHDGADRHGLTGTPDAVAKVFAPFEVACLDLQARTIGRPVHVLLGGRHRDSVAFSAYLFYKWAAHPDAPPDGFGAALDPDGIVAQARALVDRYGFRSIKLKGGVFEPDAEIDAIRALRDAFPDHPLRLDPNCAWSVDTSRKVAAATDGLLEYLEDPTPGIDGMAAVAREAGMPLATNMCVVRFADLRPAFTRGAVGVVLADHHYWGGLRASADLARMCDTWGVGVSMHSNSHLGISLAAMVQLGAAVPNLTYAADTHTPWQDGVDVVTAPLPILDGAVAVPDGPGLGVELDRDMLARLHENYLRCGVRVRDDTAYMRTVDPAFRKLRPRW